MRAEMLTAMPGSVKEARMARKRSAARAERRIWLARRVRVDFAGRKKLIPRPRPTETSSAMAIVSMAAVGEEEDEEGSAVRRRTSVAYWLSPQRVNSSHRRSRSVSGLATENVIRSSAIATNASTVHYIP